MKKLKIILVFGLLILDAWVVIWLKNKKNIVEIQTTYLNEDHYSKKETNEVFEKYNNNEEDGILAIITSHHFLAKDLIAQTFSKVSGENIEKVILVSPDHFKQIKKKDCLVMTANVGWKTFWGQADPDNLSIEGILKDDKYCQDINSFRGEHGIFTLVSFVRNYLPRAKIIPLILRSKNDYDSFYDLGKNMAKNFSDEKTLLVISSDFSHYTTESEAKKQDEQSIEILKIKDKEKISLVNSDCPQCVAFLFGYLGKNSQFNLIKNTNSFEISGENKDYVTSYVNGYYK